MILVIDYGMGNLRSVSKALEHLGGKVAIGSSAEEIRGAEKIILPGVGAFNDAMASLNERGLAPEIIQAAKKGVPFLGICLGMQILADRGFEGGECQGLGLIKGQVKRFELPKDLRVPHMGWNEVWAKASDPILENIQNGADFYFVHSYCFIPESQSNLLAETPYGGRFASMVYQENIYGAQFHPEKSSKTGMQLLKNFLKLKIRNTANHA